MDDKDKIEIGNIDWKDYVSAIGSTDHYTNSVMNGGISITGGAADINYEDWLADNYTIDISGIDIGGWDYSSSSLGADDIKLTAAGDEMLRVAKDGFYVRGVKVEADAKEAKAVYEAFKRWMTYAILNGEIND